jgi:hypothetical protein
LRLLSRILLIKSFVLGAIVLVVWVRSYFVADVLIAQVGANATSLSAAGGMVVYRATADGSNDVRIEQLKRRYESKDPETVLSAIASEQSTLGFSFSKRPRFEDGSGLVVTLVLPMWFFFLITSSKAIFWMMQRGANKATAPPTKFAWCVKCQCEQPCDANHCARCGGKVIA